MNQESTAAPDAGQHSSHRGKVRPRPYWIVTFDGMRLRQRRHDRGLSQDRLAYRSGVSLKTIQRIERLPAAGCYLGTLQRLASALSPDPDALITELTQGTSPPAPARASLASAPRPRADQWWHRAKPFPIDKTEHGRYDAAMARELLAATGELPNSKGGLLMLLTEYRRALYDMANDNASSNKPALAQ